MTNKTPITRRTFAKAMAGGLLVTLAGAALPGCSAIKGAADATLMGTRTVTDDAGRQLTIPTAGNIKHVFFTSGLAEVYICCLAPDLLAGTAQTFEDYDLPYLPDGINKLPVLGTLNENDEIDPETLLTANIDIMFSISGVGLTQANKTDADRIQKQTNIPVYLIDGSFNLIPKAFTTLGDILGKQDRAKELADYCRSCYDDVHKVVATIPEDKRFTLYYAEGPEGLQTEPAGSQHMLGFIEGGAIDAAKCEITYGGGMTDVSLEQVLKWNPEFIVSWDTNIRGGAYDDILKSSDWANIQAVKNKRVFAMPNIPWAWCDRPPGVNRLIGIHWIANLLYPDVYNVDMVQITQKFFKTMFQKDVSEQAVKGILGSSYPPPPQLRQV
jgi:iron complex transport system substrate-binding protein